MGTELMGNNSSFIGNIKRMKRVVFLVSLMFLLSCSEQEENPFFGPTLDLTVVEGKYTGSWNWEFGIGEISMIIEPSSTAGRYFVQFYESSSFKPVFNTDGVSPEAKGILVLEGQNATLELNLNTDAPPCVGDYSGTGTKTDDGILNLSMDIMHNCAEDAPATWSLTKVEEL